MLVIACNSYTDIELMNLASMFASFRFRFDGYFYFKFYMLSLHMCVSVSKPTHMLSMTYIH